MIMRHEGKDITQITTKITWSGDKKQVARVLEFGVAVNANDYYLPKVAFKMGDMVRFLDDKGKEIFQGFVLNTQKSINSSEQTVTCFDGLFFLTKSKGTYNFKGMTPEAITQKVASDFGIKLGKLESGGPLDRIFDAEIIYNIIMTAYTLESAKSNKQYIPRMIEGALNVLLKGSYTTKFVLDARTTITNSSYGESMESSINRVRIFDTEGNSRGEVTLEGVPGILQDIYKVEEGVEPMVGAKAMLKGIEQTASIEALGDIECITGNASIIKESFTGLNGLFFIDSDTHTWENGQHTMSLGLSFENIMDYQTGGQNPADIQTDNSSGSSGSGSAQLVGTGNQRVWCFLMSKGFSNEAAAGIMGNLQQESGIDPKKKQYGGGPGRGIMQWEEGMDRFASLKALASSRGVAWTDLDTQLEFFWKEFNSERTGVNKLKSKYGMSPTDLMHLKDTNRAVVIFEDCYERASKKELPKRQGYAQGFLNKYKGSDCMPKSSSSSGTSNQGVVNANGKAGDLIAAAKTFIGLNYSQELRFTSHSADCSSLVLRSMAKIGLTTTSKNLTTRNIHTDDRFYKIPKSQIQPGDVLWQPKHMALYIGNNTLIEASYTAMKVKYASYNNRFTQAFRIKGLS